MQLLKLIIFNNAHNVYIMNTLNPSTQSTESMLDGEWTSSTECVGHESVDLKWSSSVVEWMCSSVQRN